MKILASFGFWFFLGAEMQFGWPNSSESQHHSSEGMSSFMLHREYECSGSLSNCHFKLFHPLLQASSISTEPDTGYNDELDCLEKPYP